MGDSPSPLTIDELVIAGDCWDRGPRGDRVVDYLMQQPNVALTWGNQGKQSLHFEVIREIQQLLPGTPIVMHGSSSVPEEEVRRINAAGGKLDPSARGVNEEEYLPAAPLGGNQDQYRYGREAGLDSGTPGIFPGSPRTVRFSAAWQNLCGRICEFIARKNEKLGSAGQLSSVRQSLAKRT
jgi:fructose-bisphosphate aldolase class II